MNKGELKIVKTLLQGSFTVKEIASAIGLSLSQTYRNLKKLLSQGFVDKLDDTYSISRSELGFLLKRIANKYCLESLFSGRGLEVLMVLRSPRSINDLVKILRLSEQSLYNYLSRLASIGAIKFEEGKYKVVDDDLKNFLNLLDMRSIAKEIEPYAEIIFNCEDFIIKRVPANLKAKGSPTAFTLFPRYGVDISLPWNFYVEPPMDESVETALVHGLIVSETKKERTLCAILYLKNKDRIDLLKARSLAKGTPALPLLLKLEVYASGTPIEEAELFLPWDEFRELASLYGIRVMPASEASTLSTYFESIGKVMEREITCYLFGGVNLILLGVKEATKDVDIILDKVEDFQVLAKALENLGFQPVVEEVTREIGELRPSMIYRKNNMRIDVFTHVIAGGVKLTDNMKSRAKKTVIYGKLKLKLMSLEDVIFLKAISIRERDLEDIAMTLRRYKVKWPLIPQILIEQGEEAERHAVALLQTIDALEEAYNIKISRKVKARIERLALKYMIKKLIEKGYKTPTEISKQLGVPSTKIRQVMREM